MAGADEAGRGCLAGPLVAAAVLFDYERLTLSDLRALSALNDSKQHTAEMREELYPRVLRVADPRGRHLALRAGDRRARAAQDQPRRSVATCCAGSAGEGCLCLSDGFPVPPTGFEQRPVVGGDATSAAIAAASVIAKVSRDRFMQPHGGALSGLGVRAPTSATRRPSTAPRSSASASRRCTGCRSSRWPTSSSRSS